MAVVLPQLLVAESVYIPADSVETENEAGLSEVEEKLLGPLHANDVAPVAAPVSVNVLPVHNVVEDDVAETPDGEVLIVTAVVATVVVPQLLVAARL